MHGRDAVVTGGRDAVVTGGRGAVVTGGRGAVVTEVVKYGLFSHIQFMHAGILKYILIN